MKESSAVVEERCNGKKGIVSPEFPFTKSLVDGTDGFYVQGSGEWVYKISQPDSIWSLEVKIV